MNKRIEKAIKYIETLLQIYDMNVVSTTSLDNQNLLNGNTM